MTKSFKKRDKDLLAESFVAESLRKIRDFRTKAQRTRRGKKKCGN
jgi:hypothetical protein